MPTLLGWRLAFAMGVVLGLVILLVRRNVPESPRWMFIHGHDKQAHELVGGIEREYRTGQGTDGCGEADLLCPFLRRRHGTLSSHPGIYRSS